MYRRIALVLIVPVLSPPFVYLCGVAALVAFIRWIIIGTDQSDWLDGALTRIMKPADKLFQWVEAGCR
jgi:hypothetical protein